MLYVPYSARTGKAGYLLLLLLLLMYFPPLPKRIWDSLKRYTVWEDKNKKQSNRARQKNNYKPYAKIFFFKNIFIPIPWERILLNSVNESTFNTFRNE